MDCISTTQNPLSTPNKKRLNVYKPWHNVLFKMAVKIPIFQSRTSKMSLWSPLSENQGPTPHAATRQAQIINNKDKGSSIYYIIVVFFIILDLLPHSHQTVITCLIPLLPAWVISMDKLEFKWINLCEKIQHSRLKFFLNFVNLKKYWETKKKNNFKIVF